MKVLKQATLSYVIQKTKYGISIVDNLAAKTESVSGKILAVNSIINSSITASAIGITAYAASSIIPTVIAGSISTTALPIISGTITVLGAATTVAAATKACSMGVRITAYAANTTINAIENILLTEPYRDNIAKPIQEAINNQNLSTIATISNTTKTAGKSLDYGHFITKITANSLEYFAPPLSMINESLDHTIDILDKTKKIGMLAHAEKVQKTSDLTVNAITKAKTAIKRQFEKPPIKLPRSQRQIQSSNTINNTLSKDNKNNNTL